MSSAFCVSCIQYLPCFNQNEPAELSLIKTRQILFSLVATPSPATLPPSPPLSLFSSLLFLPFSVTFYSFFHQSFASQATPSIQLRDLGPPDRF